MVLSLLVSAFIVYIFIGCMALGGYHSVSEKEILISELLKVLTLPIYVTLWPLALSWHLGSSIGSRMLAKTIADRRSALILEDPDNEIASP